LALLSAATFAVTNAAVRRGVLTGSPLQATSLSIPVGVPIFFLALLLAGNVRVLFELPSGPFIAFAVTGLTHFVIGRYANYRAIRAIGTNLAGPVMQFNLVVSLALAILLLGETLTPLRIFGILLIVAGPAVARRGKRSAPAAPVKFTPKMAEGYLFAALAAGCYGLSPVLIRYAGQGRGLAASLGGGVISAASATVVTLLLLAAPGLWRDVRRVNAHAAKLFLFSGVMVYVSQIFYYMAISLAPVTIIAPISALGNVFRLHAARWFNPEHEVFGPEIIFATTLSFLGVIVLTASVEALPLPASWAAFLNWRWP
jgi:drug/metabolite transporter (DMT)-like permease